MSTTSKTVRMIGKCKACKQAARFDAVRHVIKSDAIELPHFYRPARVTSVRYTIPTGYTYTANAKGTIWVPCYCGRSSVEFAPICGRVTEHKCGARCRNSTSGICECSCGGAMHGSGHAS